MANRLDYTYRRLVNLLGPDRVARGRFETFVYSHDFAAIPKAAEAQFRFEPDFVVLPRPPGQGACARAGAGGLSPPGSPRSALGPTMGGGIRGGGGGSGGSRYGSPREL